MTVTERLAWALLNASVGAVFLGVAGGVLLALWPRRDANLRHRVWTFTLLAMLALPGLALCVPPMLRLPTPAGASLSLPPAAPTMRPTEQAAATPGEAAPLEPSADRTLETAAIEAGPLVSPSPAGGGAPWRRVSWPTIALTVYAFGAAVFTARLLLGWWRLRALSRTCVAIECGLPCEGRVAASHAVCVPLAIGIMRPTIVLPGDWPTWDATTLAAALAHEQAHVDRRDPLVALAAEVNRCVFWFHPLAWFLRRRLAQLAEVCCDDAVLAQGADRAGYAQILLDMAARLRSAGARFTPTGLAMARSSGLGGRVEAILDRTRPLSAAMSAKAVLALTVFLAPAALLAAAVRLDDQAETSSGATSVAKPAEEAPSATPDQTIETDAADVVGRVVLASDRAPVPRAQVRLFTYDDSKSNYDVRETTSDERGEFRFSDVASGKHRLVAIAEGLASRGARYKGTRVVVGDGASAQPVVLELTPAPAIRVRVTGQADGKPLAGALVRLPWSDAGHDFRTDSKGLVLLQGLTPETWHVEIQAKGFAQQTFEQALTGDQTAELDVPLAPGAAVQGVVRDEHGKPLPDIGVSVFPAIEPRRQIEFVTTDAEGRFRFESLPLGELQFNIWNPDYEDFRQNFTPSKPAGEETVDLTLRTRPNAGAVQGLVTDEQGNPLAGVELTNHGKSTRYERTAKTDEAGRFFMDRVFATSSGFELIAQTPGYALQRVSFQPGPPDKPAEITVRLAPGYRLRGRVQNPAGKPVANASVSYGRSFPLQDHAYTVTDANGRFELESLPADAKVEIGAQGYSPLDQQQLPLGGPDEVVVTLQPSGAIRGRVVDAATGSPVSRFLVRITFSPDRKAGDPSTSLPGRASIDGQWFDAPDGHFEVGGLLEGMPLQVSVEAPGFGRQTRRRVVAEFVPAGREAEFKLTPISTNDLVSVRGVIRNDQGQPLGGANLRLIVAKNRPRETNAFPFNWEMIQSGGIASVDGVQQMLTTSSDAQGNFVFEGVETGPSMEIAYWGEGVSQGRVEHLEKLSADERDHLRVSVSRPAVVRGTIDRRALPTVSQVTVTGRSVTLTTFLDKGDLSYEIRNVPPGKYELQLYGDRKPSAETPNAFTVSVLQRRKIEVKAGETLTLDLGAPSDP